MTNPITSLRHAVARATDEAMCASDPDLIRAQVLALGAEVLVALPFVTGDAATIANYARVADAMTARALAAEERADAADAPDLDYPAREALWKMRDERDAARDATHLLAVRVTQATQAGDDPAAVDATPEGAVEAVRVLRADLDTVKAQIGVIEDVSLNAQAAHDKATAEAERLRAELGRAHDELRAYASLPTYDARTVAPMVSEVAAHEAVGGAWLVVWALAGLRTAIISGDFDHGEWLSVVGTWVPLDTRRLPCAWPVVAVEGGA